MFSYECREFYVAPTPQPVQQAVNVPKRVVCKVTHERMAPHWIVSGFRSNNINRIWSKVTGIHKEVWVFICCQHWEDSIASAASDLQYLLACITIP